MSQDQKNFIACRIKDAYTLDRFLSDQRAKGVSVDSLLNRILMAYYADPTKFSLPAYVPKKKPTAQDFDERLVEKVKKNALVAFAKLTDTANVEIEVNLKFTPLRPAPGPFKGDVG